MNFMSLLRTHTLDVIAPALGAAMGLALGSSHYGVCVALGIVFMTLSVTWLATAPPPKDPDWRPFHVHLVITAIAFVLVSALVVAVFTVADLNAAPAVMAIAGGFIGMLVASASSPPAQV